MGRLLKACLYTHCEPRSDVHVYSRDRNKDGPAMTEGPPKTATNKLN